MALASVKRLRRNLFLPLLELLAGRLAGLQQELVINLLVTRTTTAQCYFFQQGKGSNLRMAGSQDDTE